MQQKILLILLLITAIFCLNSCSYLKSLSKAKSDPNYVPESGDPVEITAADGRTYKLFIREITADSLKSDKYNFALEDIREIDKLRNNPKALLMLIAIEGAVLFMIILFIKSFSFNING